MCPHWHRQNLDIVLGRYLHGWQLQHFLRQIDIVPSCSLSKQKTSYLLESNLSPPFPSSVAHYITLGKSLNLYDTFSFLICKMDITGLWDSNKVIHIKDLTQCLAHRYMKCLIIISYHYWYRWRFFLEEAWVCHSKGWVLLLG